MAHRGQGAPLVVSTLMAHHMSGAPLVSIPSIALFLVVNKTQNEMLTHNVLTINKKSINFVW